MAVAMDGRSTPAVAQINPTEEERQRYHRDLQAAQNAGIDINALAQVNRRNEAIGQAVGTLGLLAEVLAEEIAIWRLNMQQRGVRVRRFLHDFFNVQLGAMWRPILRVFARTHPYKPICLEGSAALGDDALKYQDINSETKVSSYSLSVLAKILLSDDVEEGITRRFQFWSEPWPVLPPRKINAEDDDGESRASEFQLFNRPLSFDDDEILSLPSTQQTGNFKIQALEAKMAKLSQQLAAVLATQSISRSRVSSGNSNQKSPSAASNISSDDGVCLQSIRSSRSRNESPAPSLPSISAKMTALPVVRPPPGPPPPPPPPPFTSISHGGLERQAPSRLDFENLQPASPFRAVTNINIESSSPGIRVQDLISVKLRKTNATKSPGGTPCFKKPLRENQSMESGEFLATALRNKFRNVHPSVAEDDESNTNTSFNDDEWAAETGDACSSSQVEEMEGLEIEVESEQILEVTE